MANMTILENLNWILIFLHRLTVELFQKPSIIFFSSDLKCIRANFKQPLYSFTYSCDLGSGVSKRGENRIEHCPTSEWLFYKIFFIVFNLSWAKRNRAKYPESQIIGSHPAIQFLFCFFRFFHKISFHWIHWIRDLIWFTWFMYLILFWKE